MDGEFISGYPDLILYRYQTCNYIDDIKNFQFKKGQ